MLILGTHYALQKGLFQPTQRTFMKQALVLSVINLMLSNIVHPEDGKRIDKIG